MSRFRVIQFFKRSIRNKLMVALPLAAALFLLVPFSLSIISLRQQVLDHFIEHGREHIQLLVRQINDPSKSRMFEEALFGNDMLYLRLVSHKGEVEEEKYFKEGLSFDQHSIQTVYPKVDAVEVRRVTISGESALEFVQDTGREKVFIGLSLAGVNHLLLTQTITILLITLLAVGSLAIVIVLMSYTITRPIVKLSDQAEAMARGKRNLEPVAVETEDEVGQMANTLNHLIGKVAELQKIAEEAAAAAATGKLVTQVAHDIRNPLSSLQAAVGYFKQLKVADPRFSDLLNLLELSSKRLGGVADDLLKHHRHEPAQNTIFSLHHILDELIGEYQMQEKYQQIQFVKHYMSNAFELHGDRRKLQRAFGNLMINAIEAMDSKGTITLETALQEGRASVTIADTGPGMGWEKLARVLAGGHSEGKKNGHGIGITVVQETIKEFRGLLQADSEEGKGTKFIIVLPPPQAEELISAPRETTAVENWTLKVSGEEPIVVIDDSDALREQWRIVLGDKGRNVLLCESYEEFVEMKITSAISKTAIVDYHFDNSEKDGADIIPLLRARGLERLTLCTAEYWKPVVMELAKNLGVELCPKPLPRVEVEVLTDVIARSESDEAIPISNIKGEGYKVLVIDDDDCLEIAWKMTQDDLKIAQLNYFKNLELLQTAGIDPKNYDIAFVDRNFDNSKFHGGQVIDYLKDQGMQKVVVASGWNAEEIKKDPRFARADFISTEKIPQSLSQYFS